MPIQDDELLRDFVIESLEHLASVESQLLDLEGQLESVDLGKVNNVFRAVHSIKGVARFLNLDNLESLAHREEEVLNRLRNCELRPTTEVVNTLLKATDRLRTMIETIETSSDEDISEHVAALERLLSHTNQGDGDHEESKEANDNQSPIEQTEGLVNQFAQTLLHLESHSQDAEALQSLADLLTSIRQVGAECGGARLSAHALMACNALRDLIGGGGTYGVPFSVCMTQTLQYLRKQVAAIQQNGRESEEDDRSIAESYQSTLTMQMQAKMSTDTRASEIKKETSLPASESQSVAASESTIRVDVALLDKLMTRVGELVLARNQILQFAGRIADSDLQGATQRLNLITTELQEGVMKTRMQPIGNVWSKLPRLVRDLGGSAGNGSESRCTGRKPSSTRRSSKPSRIH